MVAGARIRTGETKVMSLVGFDHRTTKLGLTSPCGRSSLPLVRDLQTSLPRRALDVNRTHDLLLTMQALFQLSYKGNEI